MWSKNISSLILAFNTTEIVTDQSQIRSFSKKDKLMGGLGEEKSGSRKIVNEIRGMRGLRTGEGRGISASIDSLSLPDLSGSRV